MVVDLHTSFLCLPHDKTGYPSVNLKLADTRSYIEREAAIHLSAKINVTDH
jgi:hypothetical protein